MKLIVLMIFFSFSVFYAEPKNNVDNSPKLCLETIYKKNFDAAPQKENGTAILLSHPSR
jgi:hypothetical protein